MTDLDLIPTSELLEVIRARQEAKQVVYLLAIATDDNQSYDIWHNFTYEDAKEDLDELIEIIQDPDNYEGDLEFDS